MLICCQVYGRNATGFRRALHSMPGVEAHELARLAAEGMGEMLQIEHAEHALRCARTDHGR